MIFAFAIILLLAVNSLSSQVDLGVMTGLQTTNANYKPNEPFAKTLYPKLLLGLYSKFGIYDSFSIQFSPSYTKKKIEASQFFYNIVLESDYIDIPILLSYELDFGLVKPYVFVGPNIGIITNPVSSIDYYNPNSISQTKDISEDVEKIEYAIKIGAGLEFEFDTFSLFGQALYSHGLNNVYNAPEGVTFPDEVYLRSIDIQFGISIPVGRNSK